MARKTAPKAAKPREIPPGLRRALADRKPGADSEALLADLIDVWGGTRQLALDLYQEFKSAGAGGMTRQRILEMIQRLIITNTTHDIGRQVNPSDLSDDELQAVAMRYVARLSHDADPAAGPAAAAETGEG